MSEQKKIWMVRLGNLICGPYETVVVESLLKEQKITEIDEVALPCKGWEYVRDRGEFLAVLDTMRSNSFNKAGSFSGTANITQIEADDRTAKVSSTDQADDTKTTPLVDFNELEIEKKKNNNNFSQQNTIYKTTRTNKGAGKIFIGAMALVVLGCVAFMLKTKGYNPVAILKVVNQEDFNQAWLSGDYTESLKILKSSESLKEKNRLEYASLLLMEKNEFSGVDKVLDSSDYKDSAKWKNLKGLWHQYSEDLDVAESKYLSALKKSPNNTPSLVNLGFLYRNKGQWSDARSYFESAFAKSASKGFDGVEFYLFESWMRQNLADSGLTNFERINSNLQNKKIGLSTYKHEFMLSELWLFVTAKPIKNQSLLKAKEEDLSNTLLEMDPGVLTERFLNPYIYRAQPGGLSYLCDDLKEKMQEALNKKAVIGLCHIVDKKYGEASRVLSSATQSETVLVLRSFIAQIEKNPDRATEYLSKAMEKTGGTSPTKFFFQARFCFQKGDMRCSAEYWMKALDMKPDSYTALTGLGQSYFQVGDYEKSRTFAKRSAEFVDSYGPLIDLQTRLKKVN